VVGSQTRNIAAVDQHRFGPLDKISRVRLASGPNAVRGQRV
jgi:hypothetical protein